MWGLTLETMNREPFSQSFKPRSRSSSHELRTERSRKSRAGYGPHSNDQERTYPHVLWATRERPPEQRLEEAVRFLGSWRALRFAGGATHFRIAFSEWLRVNSGVLLNLQRRPLVSLSSRDFYSVLYLAASLTEKHLPPTTFGTLLHFLLPETVMLWDQAVVRNGYGLANDPCSFVSYQCFGFKLLRHITRSTGPDAIQELEERHAELAYYEPVTRILDHLAYNPPLRTRAVAALGGHDTAFQLDLPIPR